MFSFVLQSGCCKPPTDCGYVYQNETVWIPGSGLMGTNADCTRWSNDQEQLCYACDSCKAGVLASLKKSWRKVSVINIVVMIILVIVYIIAYAAYRNNRKMDNDEPYGEARMTKAQPSAFHLQWHCNYLDAKRLINFSDLSQDFGPLFPL